MTRITFEDKPGNKLSFLPAVRSSNVWKLTLVLLVFTALSCIYSAVTPLFESTGEPFSFRYALTLAQTGRLPDVVIPTDWWQQNDATQPPLYYALSSLFVHGIPKDALANMIHYNPYATLGVDPTGNKNVVVHPVVGSALPQVRSALNLLRLLSLVISLGSLVFTFRIARILVPNKPLLHLAAISLAAFNPLFIVSSSSANSNSLVLLWFTLALYISLEIVCQQRFNWRWFVALGICVGLAALTSVSGLISIVLLPITAFLLNGNVEPNRKRTRTRLFFVSLLLALTVAGWWYWRNWVLYSHPLLLSFTQAIADKAQAVQGQGLFSLLSMYWGIFGWGNIRADQVYYSVTGVLGTLGIMGLLVQLARIFWERRELQHRPWRSWLLALGWCILAAVWAVFVKNLIQPRVMGLLALSSVLAVAIPSGLKAWLPARLGQIVMWIMPILLLLMAVIIPFHYIIPAYQPTPVISIDQIPRTIRDVNLNYEDQLFLLGYELSNDHVKSGESVTLSLYWLCQKKTDLNYSVSIRIYGRDQKLVGSADTYPDSGRRATQFLVPGNVIRDVYAIQIDKDAVSPTAADIRVALYSTIQGRNLSVSDTRGKILDSMPVVARLAIVPAQPVPQAQQVVVDYNLGNKIQLVGYTLDSSEMLANGKWSITLYWRSISPLSEDYTVFVHLLDDRGTKIAQVDEQPINNYYPTSLWQTQDIIRDTHTLILPSDFASGNYTLSIGMYLLSTGMRLPIIPSSPPITEIKLGPYNLPTR
jgi:4-amino-4-deoxy-L-arabinose transferase-like glycosyltransferase